MLRRVYNGVSASQGTSAVGADAERPRRAGFEYDEPPQCAHRLDRGWGRDRTPEFRALDQSEPRGARTEKRRFSWSILYFIRFHNVKRTRIYRVCCCCTCLAYAMAASIGVPKVPRCIFLPPCLCCAL